MTAEGVTPPEPPDVRIGVRRSAVVGVIAVVDVVVQFLFQWYLVVRLGPGVETDALFAAMAVPQFVVIVVSTSLALILVPLLAGDSGPESQRDGWTFFWIITTLFGSVAVVISVSAPLWVHFLVPGFSQRGVLLATDLLRIQAIGMVFTAQATVLSSFRYARQSFVAPAVSAVIASAVSMLLLFVFLPRFGVYAAATLLALRGLITAALLLPSLGRPRRPAVTEAIRTAWHRARPLLLGTTYYRTDAILDRVLTSFTPPGGLSLYFLGQQSYAAALFVFNKALALPMLAVLGDAVQKDAWARFRSTYRRYLLATVGISLLVYAVIFAAGQFLLRIVIRYGLVKDRDVHMLWVLLVLFGGYWIGFACGHIAASAFYAIGDTLTPTLVGAISYTLGIVLKISLLGFGLYGIAVGTSLYYIAYMAVLVWLLERRLKTPAAATPATGPIVT